jgi:hypothetical protein
MMMKLFLSRDMKIDWVRHGRNAMSKLLALFVLIDLIGSVILELSGDTERAIYVLLLAILIQLQLNRIND